jgi:GTP cyclohydrolase I
MSRLYLQVEEALSSHTLGVGMLHQLLRGFLDSHKDLSDRACLSIRFEHLVRRPALRSSNSGWRAYPVCVEASLTGDELMIEFGTEIVYSSTCPASAALSRQLIQDQFAKDFDATQPIDHAAVLSWLGSERGIVATPHAQRSVARIRVRPSEGQARRRAGFRAGQRRQPDVLRRRVASHSKGFGRRRSSGRFPRPCRTPGEPASA